MKEGWLDRQLSKTAESKKEMPAWKQELRDLNKRNVVSTTEELEKTAGSAKKTSDTDKVEIRR
jgi:hypothetical protein